MKLVKNEYGVFLKGVAACSRCRREVRFMLELAFLSNYLETIQCDRCDPHLAEVKKKGIVLEVLG